MENFRVNKNERIQIKQPKTVEELESEMLDKFSDLYTSLNSKYTEALQEIKSLRTDLDLIKKKYDIHVDPTPDVNPNPNNISIGTICKDLNKLAKKILYSPITDSQIEALETSIKEYFDKNEITNYEIHIIRDLFCDDVVNLKFSIGESTVLDKVLVGGSND